MTEEPIQSRIIQCFGRVILIRLPRINEVQGSTIATIQLGGDLPESEVGLLYVTEYPLNQMFDVEITLRPISPEEKKEISHSQPVML